VLVQLVGTDQPITGEQPHLVKSEIPGYSYRRAGWVKWRTTRGMVYLRCPRPQLLRALDGAALPPPDLGLFGELTA